MKAQKPSLRSVAAFGFCFVSFLLHREAFGNDRDTRVRSIYLAMEATTKEAIEKKLELVKLHKPSATSIELQITREFTYMMEYQRLIDTLACATQVSTPEEVMPCLNDRAELTSDMLHFQAYNSYAIEKHDALCAAKTRMTALERKYPPYDFMHKNASGFRAVDPKAYMECIRQRL